jgi:hypothetical protein
MMRKPATAPTDDRCLDARAQAAQAFKLGHCAREVVARHAKYARLSRTTFRKSAGERGALACAVQEAGSAHAAVNGMRRVHENLGTGVSRRAHKRAHGKEQGVVWFGVYIMPQWLKVMREGLFPLLDRKWHPEDLPGVLTSPCKHRVLYCILKTCGLCYILRKLDKEQRASLVLVPAALWSRCTSRSMRSCPILANAHIDNQWHCPHSTGGARG